MAAVNGTYDLEQGVFSFIPGLVGKALGPARSWFNGVLEWVCGDPEKLQETGQKYVTLGGDVSRLGAELMQLVEGVPSWQGPAAIEYRQTMAKSVDVLDKVGGFVGKTNEILVAAAEIATEAANIIWDLVVELVKWLVQTLISALASSTISFGATIAAWLGAAIGQVAKVVTTVTKIVTKVGGFLQKIMALLQKLVALIKKFKAILEKVQAILRKIKELTKLRDKVPAGMTWEEYKSTHQATGSSVFRGQDPDTLVDRTPWVPTTSTGNPRGNGVPDWQYEGGHGGTGAAGVGHGNDGTTGRVPVTPGYRPNVPDGSYGGGSGSYGGAGSYGGGSYSGPGSYGGAGSRGGAGSYPPGTGTQAATVTGGVSGGAAGVPSGGGALTGGAGPRPGGGTSAAGMGGGMMPMMGGVGGGSGNQPKSSQNLAKGETPLAAPAAGGAPMVAPGKKDDKKRTEGRGVLTTERLGEEHDEKAAAGADRA